MRLDPTGKAGTRYGRVASCLGSGVVCASSRVTSVGPAFEFLHPLFVVMISATTGFPGQKTSDRERHGAGGVSDSDAGVRR